MKNVVTIGLDIAKSVLQVHGINAAGEVVIRRRLSRGGALAFFEKLPRCLVGIEACNTAHFWARELIARGHEVRLMPAQYVKPYVRRGKIDVADAEAICEAVTRPTMRFVAVKSPEQQSAMMLHQVRIGADARSRLKPPDQENPFWPVHLECELLVGIWSARKASWPAAHVRAASKAEHMAAPTSPGQKQHHPCQRRAVHTRP
jgi:hypothetical protein